MLRNAILSANSSGYPRFQLNSRNVRATHPNGHIVPSELGPTILRMCAILLGMPLLAYFLQITGFGMPNSLAASEIEMNDSMPTWIMMKKRELSAD